MTAPDPVRSFRDALPDWAWPLGVHSDLRAIVDIHAAAAAGLDLEQLAKDVTYHARGLDNAAQVIRHRLHRAAHPDETNP